MKRALLLLVRLYQVALSPFIGRSCRFHPSCSHYAAEAIRTHGAAKGTVLTARRICKCNPWHPGGYDPVPPAGRRQPQAAGGEAVTNRDRMPGMTRPEGLDGSAAPGSSERPDQSGPMRCC